MVTTHISANELIKDGMKHDYPEGAHQSDQEARRVLAAEMMLWEIPHFSQPKVHTVLFVNVLKYMAFLQMQESMRGDW